MDKAIYFYGINGEYLGCAIEGPAADRMEDQLKVVYGKITRITEAAAWTPAGASAE